MNKNLTQLKLAIKQEYQKNSRHGKSANIGGYVNTAHIFFRYTKLVPETKISDWVEFALWVDKEISNDRNESFYPLSHFDYSYQFSNHKLNVTCKVELPSEVGYWKFMKQLSLHVKSLKPFDKIGVCNGHLIRPDMKKGESKMNEQTILTVSQILDYLYKTSKPEFDTWLVKKQNQRSKLKCPNIYHLNT